MAQAVVVNLEGVVSKEAVRKELSQYEQMLEVTSWSNRLDSKLQARIKDIKDGLSEAHDSLESECLEDAKAILSTLRKSVLPELVELCVVASDHVYFVDRYSSELKERLERLEAQLSSVRKELPVRMYLKLKNKLTSGRERSNQVSLRSQNVEGLAERERELRVKFLDFDTFDYDPLVNNQNTPFELYDNWVTTFHANGKSYGASNIVYSDLSERIFDLNKVCRIKDKNILEIGPFEGGNTKQLFDLGAKSITAIESNREFYFKTALVKDAFSLDDLTLYFGDCNELLLNRELFSEGSFDLLYASGVLYHMSEPIETIITFSKLADRIYVNSHIASEQVPKGEWITIDASNGKSYRGRRNVYEGAEHWGGVDTSAIWLDRESMIGIFVDLGYSVSILEDSENAVRGDYLGFIAERKSE